MKNVTIFVLGSFVISTITFPPKRVAADTAVSSSPHSSAVNNSPMRKDAIPWSKKMQELYKTLADVLTDVTSDRRFNDPANKEKILAEATRLESLVHDLGKKTMVSVDTDPTIPIVAMMLGEQTKQAVIALKRDNRTYARSILRTVPGYCIACHTRNASGPQFAELPFEPSSTSLSPLERGEFFAATRQFERAQGDFRSIIQDPKAVDTNVLDWETAVRDSLAIAVRVQESPIQAQEIVQTILKTPNAPSYMREDAKSWNASIIEWQSEPPHHALTEEGLRSEAIRLMAKARETQKYPMDRTGDIQYLRASAAVHNLLQTSPKGDHLSEALLLAGLSYEVLKSLQTEDLHEVFYGACIRSAPHTLTADVCYRRLEENIMADYTGSSGIHMPEDIHQSLRDMRELSQPVSISPK